jgi:hypothetical protein
MSMARLWVDPALAEEAVFERMRALESDSHAEVRRWQQEREAVYARPESARSSAFTELARAWFERLDLAQPLRAALELTPHVRAQVAEIRLHRVARAAQEGSELYREAGITRLVFGLGPARFGDSALLPEFFLRECLYAEDMLDPAAGFSPDLDPALEDDGARAELVRDRLSVLWEARVTGRGATLLGIDPAAEPRLAFRRAFAGTHTPAEIGALHERASRGDVATFSQLLATARGDPRVSLLPTSPAAVRAGMATWSPR